VAAEVKLSQGYRVVINNGEHGGQTVDHLHVHLLGDRLMTLAPVKLLLFSRILGNYRTRSVLFRVGLLDVEPMNKSLSAIAIGQHPAVISLHPYDSRSIGMLSPKSRWTTHRSQPSLWRFV
jgi:diadenosine tetraphosphate (Ap4A) HIT family hydrolase